MYEDRIRLARLRDKIMLYARDRGVRLSGGTTP